MKKNHNIKEIISEFIKRGEQEFNIKNFPAFLLTGFILIIIIILIIYFLFLHYSPETIIPYEGYAVEPKIVENNLQNQSIEQVQKTVHMVKVKEDETLFKKLSDYFIGENEKNKIDIKYPIYLHGNSAIYNLSGNTKLITVNYEEVEGYPEYAIANGVMYNGDDLTRADSNEYLFLKNEENIFINAQEIEVITSNNEYKIPIYSSILFSAERIAYYEVYNGVMQYHSISDIDYDSKIIINGETYTYREFLEKLKIVKEENEEPEEIPEEVVNNVIENTTIEEEQVNKETHKVPEEIPENNNNEEEKVVVTPDIQNKYQKPEVSCTEFDTRVYTTRTTISVNDPSNAITKSPIFEISKDGKVYKRIKINNTGLIEIAGLIPDTEFNVKGIYYYKDENRKDKEEVFVNTTIHTQTIDSLGTIKLNYKNGEIFPNKIELKDLEILNDKQEEVIKGISTMEIEANGNIYRVKTSLIKKILNGEKIVYQTEETVKSDSNIKYKIHIYDKFGNELKTENSEGTTRTSKQHPSVIIRLKKQEATEVSMELNLINNDNVKIENYRYSVTNMKGEEVAKGNLETYQKELILTTLNPNDYYTIYIYGDYDLNDEKGIIKDNLLSEGNFTTLPVSSLGSVFLKDNINLLGINNVSIAISLDSELTDNRLINILSGIEVKIIPIDNENAEEKSILFNSEQLNKLKNNEEIILNFNLLNSNTKYQIQIIVKAQQGTVEEVVDSYYETKEFITMKQPAEVQIRNQFVTGNMLDFDIRVEDIDGAVLTQKVVIEFRNEKEELIIREEMNVNEDYVRKIYDKLEENKVYYLRIFAPEYNEGNTDTTYQSNYLLKEVQIYTELGITGKLDLVNLSKKVNGKNLIDVSSNINWYVYPTFNTSDYYGKEYNTSTEELRLGQNGNWRRCVYDLREYAGQTVTISFKIKYVNNNDRGTVYIQNAKTDKNRTQITGITAQYTDKTYTMQVDSSGYLGFYIQGGQGVYIKELQIELGSKKTKYEKFTYSQMNAQFKVNLQDRKDEITTNDYYIRIYENDKQIIEERYEEINEENKVVDVIKNYGLDENKNYRVELLVKIRDRYYVIDSQKFKTDAEIKGIFNKEDFLELQRDGNYIVLGDIDLSGMTGITLRFGGNFSFKGNLDFNGYTLTRDAQSTSYIINPTGVIENLVFNVKLNNKIEIKNFNGLSGDISGKIRNIQVNVIESTRVPNVNLSILCHTLNQGAVLENFDVNFKVPVYGAYRVGLMNHSYSGIVRNGYIHGENMIALDKPDSQNRDFNPLMYRNSVQGSIKNVYSLVNVEFTGTSNENSTNLVGVNDDNASISNIYSVGIGSISNLKNGPNVYGGGSKNITNNYYFADEIFTSNYHKKTTPLALHDVTFQNQIINSDGAFNVEELVKNGYYPQINMPDVMPRQEFIRLPEVKDSDLADILSTEVLEQGTNKIKVKFSVNNPSGENINEIKIENINVNIVSQEYEDGKTQVIAELYDPVKYISKYNVQSITTQGAFNIPFTRTFKQGERVIEVDLYKEINSVQDWKDINTSPTENYMLMTDLDFANEGNTIVIDKTYTGKLNGNNHTIKNIFLDQQNLIMYMNGTFENLNIENFQKKTGKNISNMSYALIYSTTNAYIDNVHIKNVTIESTETREFEAGALVSRANSTSIRNCSANNVNIKKTSDDTINYAYVGGLVGYYNGTTLENCYVKNINIDIKSSSGGYYVGGIAGFFNVGTIQNSYAQGQIKANGQRIGGIVGYGNNYWTDLVKNCYSDVDIISKDDYIGGIIGQDRNDASNNVLNNLSLGYIYSMTNSTMIGRIAGSNQSKQNNYAYEEQKINGSKTTQTLGATLLSYEELCKKSTYTDIIQLGSAYDYTDIEKGILPKLYNTNGKELLPNQEDIKLVKNGELEIEDVTSDKAGNNTVNTVIQINNPNQLPIIGIQVEDMENTIQKNNTIDGKTYIEINAKPIRYYDSYRISKIIYMENNEEKEIEVSAKIDVQFYKEIYNYEDWQSIEQGTYENYRLMNDIDFEGKEVNKNITMARLESDGKTLKNINITANGNYTGLITEITQNMSNIRFENITITNTTASSYIGIIAKSTAKMDNIVFSNININTKSSYIGCIGYVSNEKAAIISNVSMNDVTVKGTNNVGGLVAVNENKILQVNADNITVSGTSNVGGIIGYSGEIFSNASSQWSNYNFSNITLTNSNITGSSNNVGGVVGNTKRRVINTKVSNTTVKGWSSVGGVVGNKQYNYGASIDNIIVDNCEIYGNGTDIGGIIGWSADPQTNGSVINSKIIGQGTGSNNVGGIVGTERVRIVNSSVENSQIITKGAKVGGIAGYVYMEPSDGSGGEYIQNCYVKDTSVEGNSKVGGLIGSIRNGNIYYNYTNATVNAIKDYAGGLIGYLENQDMTAAARIITLYDNNVAGAQISGKTKVGGFVGGIAKDLYKEKDFFYNNFIHAYITSNDSNVSLGIGSSKSNNSTLKNTYVYKYSKINNEYVNENNDTFKANQYITGAQLKLEATYRNTFGWGSNFNYTTLKNNKYPIVTGNKGQQTGIDLPTDPVSETQMQQNMLLTAENLKNAVSLGEPESKEIEYKVYVISANEINLDLKNVKDGAKLKIGQVEIPVKSRVYTLKYDFNSTQKLELIQDNKVIEINIKPSELKNYTSLIGENYAYINGSKLIVNGEEIEGEYVNLYKDQALTSNGEIYNIETKKLDSSINQIKGIELSDVVKPKEEYEYKGQDIKAYGIFSSIDGQIRNQIYEVKNGKLFILSDKLNIMKTGQKVVEIANSKEYETILNENGVLKDLKEKLVYPDKFKNEGIKEICQNIDSEKTTVLVYYDNGEFTIFNYLTGEVNDSSVQKEKMNLIEYVKKNVYELFNTEEEKTNEKEYEETKEIVEKLEKIPIEIAIQENDASLNIDNTNNNIEPENNGQVDTELNNNNNNISNNNDNNGNNNNNSIGNTNNVTGQSYITSYNPETNKYEIYNEEEIINSKTEDPVSENNKIIDYGLNEFYDNMQYSKGENKEDLPIVLIIVLIISGIGVCIILVYRHLKK